MSPHVFFLMQKDWTLVLFEFGTEEPRVICSRGMDSSDGTNGHPAHEVASAYDDTPGAIFWHCKLRELLGVLKFSQISSCEMFVAVCRVS